MSLNIYSPQVIKWVILGTIVFLLSALGFDYANSSGRLVGRTAYANLNSWDLTESVSIVGIECFAKKRSLPMGDVKRSLYPSETNVGDIWIYTWPLSWRERRVIHGRAQSLLQDLDALNLSRQSSSRADSEAKFRQIYNGLKESKNKDGRHH